MSQFIYKNDKKVFFSFWPFMQGNVRAYLDTCLLKGSGGVAARAINQPTFLKICMRVTPVSTKKN